MANPINLNLSGITNQSTSKAKSDKTEEKKEQEQVQQNESKNVAADTVLDFLQGSANIAKIDVKTSVKSLISKYNSPEAAARIAKMMGEFEDGVVQGLAQFEKEMGESGIYQNLSDADKMALAAKLYAQE